MSSKLQGNNRQTITTMEYTTSQWTPPSFKEKEFLVPVVVELIGLAIIFITLMIDMAGSKFFELSRISRTPFRFRSMGICSDVLFVSCFCSLCPSDQDSNPGDDRKSTLGTLHPICCGPTFHIFSCWAYCFSLGQKKYVHSNTN